MYVYPFDAKVVSAYHINKRLSAIFVFYVSLRDFPLWFYDVLEYCEILFVIGTMWYF